MTRKKKNRAETRNGISRRDLLRYGAGAAGLAAISGVGRKAFARPAPPATGPKLVICNLRGGNDGLNTVVPVTLQSYYDQRPGLSLESVETLTLDAGPRATSYYRFHPALVNAALMWADGDLAVVQKVGYPDANESHFLSETVWSRARRNVGPSSQATSGWVARLANLMAPTATGAIAVGSGNPEEFKGAATPLLTINGSLSSFAFEVDGAYGSTNDPYRKQFVRSMLEGYAGDAQSEKIRDTLLLGHELSQSILDAEASYVSTVTYESDSFSRDLASIAKLIQAGFETKVFYVDKSGFDTHGSQAGAHNSLLGDVDRGLGSFAADLKEMGVWDDTVILVISEFGRRTYENGSAGTDHGTGNCLLALGGAVNGGLFGEDLAEADLLEARLEYAIDFRSVYREVVERHFGAGSEELDLIFPEPPEIVTTLGLV